MVTLSLFSFIKNLHGQPSPTHLTSFIVVDGQRRRALDRPRRWFLSRDAHRGSASGGRVGGVPCSMGISGLLPLLKDIQHSTHVEAYRGKTLGIDAYVWLHRGAYACATDLALGRPTTRFITYAMHRIRMLQHYGVKPYVVFDGAQLPSKAGTERERAARRREHRMRGLQFHAEKRTSAARDAFVRSVDITPALAYELIKQLRVHGIPYLVAPYEADAQLAYLERHGIIDAIITEDSDLLVFGCNKVLFKLDTYGNCLEIDRARFDKVKQLSFEGWTHQEFRQMAILSGCDYLPSITGMGLKNAHKFLRKYESVEKVLRALRLEGKWRIPPTYAADFERAEFTFAHQRVFDPRCSDMSTLTPLPSDARADLVAAIGAPLSVEEARAIARGDLCPITRRHFVQQVMTPSQLTLRTFFGAATAPCKTPPSARADSSSSTATTASSLFDAPPSSSPCTSPAPSDKEDSDPCVSSPVSSPSPPRPAHSTPQTTPGLAWHAATPDDDMARRSAWFQRFKYSGARARHIVLPGTSPHTSTPRLALGKRACPTPTSPSKRPAMDTPSRVHNGSAKLLQFQYRES